ncbi:ferric/cupric-chelate reductase [Rhizophlyctis rosea]|nr:ferric/cupric-chelate reductase [Rhizophlyctis rosea]
MRQATLDNIVLATGVFALAGGLGSSYAIVKHGTCYVGLCIEMSPGNRQDMHLIALYVFYAFLFLSAVSIYIIRQTPRLDKFFRTRPSIKIGKSRLHAPLSVGELTICACAMAIALWKFSYFFMSYFSNGIRVNKNSTWRFSMFNLLGHASGHPMDLLLGFVMLPISRNSVLGTHLKIPFDAALKFHRLAGWGMLIWGLFHGSVYMGKIYNNPNTTLWNDLFKLNIDPAKKSFKSYMTLFGAIALVCFILAAVPALPFLRRRFFNVFYVMHGFMLLMILAACMHSSTNMYFMLPGLILWAVDLTIRSTSWWSNKHTKITNATIEPNALLRLDITSPTIKTYLPTQYVFLNIPTISALEFHPYSVCSKPNSNTITLLLDPKDFSPKEWTRKVERLVVEKGKGIVGERVKLEGPFGWLGFELNEVDRVVCFVSGTGVVPALGIVRHLMDGMVDLDGKVKIVVYWSTRVRGCGEISLIQEIMQESGPQLEIHIYETSTPEMTITSSSTTSLETVHVVSDKEKDEPVSTSSWLQIHQGRMDPRSIIAQHPLSGHTGIFMCGNRSLMRDVRTAVADRGMECRIHRKNQL